MNNQIESLKTISISPTLLINSRVIQQGFSGPKVLELNNQNFLKIFRLKSWFSSALYQHYADRFLKNSFILKNLNIATVDIINIYKLPRNYTALSKLTKAVEYRPLEGITFRQLISSNISEQTIINFGKFIAKLHGLGIYFKANHFGNIIYAPDFIEKYNTEFGLIDIDNIKFYNRPLNSKQIAKNFYHMTRYDSDKSWFEQNYELFMRGYTQ